MTWRYKADIKKYINDFIYHDKGTPESVAKGTAKLIRQHPVIPSRFASRLERASTEKGIDKILSDLYDYADSNRIWLGL